MHFVTPLPRQRDPSEDHLRDFENTPVEMHFAMSTGSLQHGMTTFLPVTSGVQRIRIPNLTHSQLLLTLNNIVIAQLNLLMLRQRQQRVYVLRLLIRELAFSYKHRPGTQLLLLGVKTQFLNALQSSHFQ
jgi:hypothetical protein